MHFGEGAAEYGEILGEDVDHAAIDGAIAGDHAIAGGALLFQAEVVRAVRDQHVQFFEAAFVEQQVEALARREFAPGVLRRNALFAATETSAFFNFVQFGDFIAIGHCGAPFLKTNRFSEDDLCFGKP